MRRILVPVAHLDSCRGAIALGGELARHLDVALTILHVSTEPSQSLLGGRLAAGKLAEWGIEPPSFQLLRDAEQILIDDGVLQTDEQGHPLEVHSLKLLAEGLYEVHRVSRRGQNVRFRLREGDPVRQVLRELEDPNYDLVVSGTQPIGGFRRFWVGSIAQSIAQYAPCSALLAKNLREDQGILVGVSGRETALEAVRQAAELAWIRGVPLGLLAAPPDDEGRAMAQDHLNQAEAAIEPEIRRELTIERRIIVADDPAQALIDAADEGYIIALGKVKRARVRELFLGDVSLDVLAKSTGPVLIASEPRSLDEAGGDNSP